MSFPIQYRCPNCDRLFFKAAHILPVPVQAKCKDCGLVEPQPHERPMMRTYECSRCHRTQHCAFPVQDRTHCIICGTPTLIIISEIPARPTEAPAPTAVG